MPRVSTSSATFSETVEKIVDAPFGLLHWQEVEWQNEVLMNNLTFLSGRIFNPVDVHRQVLPCDHDVHRQPGHPTKHCIEPNIR